MKFFNRFISIKKAMKVNRLIYRSSIMALLTLICSSGYSIDYYVAPTGSDGAAGTLAAPFATIAKARDAVKALGTLTANANVYIRGGWYFQTAPLAFDQTNSGSGGFNVVYQAYPNEYPVISGGKRVTGWSQVAGKNIWKATAPSGISNRQLYVNCVRAVRAHKGSGLSGASKTTTGITTSDAAAMQNWGNKTDIELIWNAPPWSEKRGCVSTISGTAITIQDPAWTKLNTGGQYTSISQKPEPIDVENAYELLDKRGEWYLDRTAQIVYYIPLEGEDMNSAVVIAPSLETVMSLTGTSGSKVKNIQFKGITFAHGTWFSPSGSDGFVDGQSNFLFNGGPRMPGNISLQYTSGIRFESCVFKHLGARGLEMYNGSSNNAVVGCLFTDISGTCILVGNNSSSNPAAELRDTADTVMNCYIHDSPCEYRGGCGILATWVRGLQLLHNEIGATPYSGISTGWSWGTGSTVAQNNHIKYNNIYRTNRNYADGGPVYTLGNQPSSTISCNYHHDVYRADCGALYNDEGSTGFTLDSNVTENLSMGRSDNEGTAYYKANNGNAGVVCYLKNTYTTSLYTNFVLGSLTTITNTQLYTLPNRPAEVVRRISNAGIQPAWQSVRTLSCGCSVNDIVANSMAKPTVKSGRVIDPTHIELEFSKALEPASAQNTANYQISGGTAIFSILVSAKRVIIQTSAPISENSLYTVTINNVRDNQATPNTIAANTAAQVYGSGYNLVGWWKFNETSGTTANDASGHGYNGTLTGSATWTSGTLGNSSLGGAIRFGGDASKGSVSIPAAALGALTGGNCAATAWIKMEENTWNPVFSSPGNKMTLNLWGGNTDWGILGYGYNANVQGNDLNRWMHIVLQKKGKAAQLYRDGFLVFFDSAGSTKGTDIWSIGAKGSSAFKGTIDDVRLYDRALTDDEITLLASGYAGPATMSTAVSLKPVLRLKKVPEKVLIFTLNGALVKEIDCTDKKMSLRHVVVSNGIYIVKSMYGGKCVVRKVVVNGRDDMVLSRFVNIQ